MLKMVIRMDDDKINIEKNTVWREYTRQLTTRLSKWAFPAGKMPPAPWYIWTMGTTKITDGLGKLSIP